MAANDYPKLKQGAVRAAAAFSLALLALALVANRGWFPSLLFVVEPYWLVVAAAAGGGLAWLAARRSSRLLLVFVLVEWLVLVVPQAGIFGLALAGHQVWLPRIANHPTLGPKSRAGSVEAHWSLPDFRVRYSMNDQGWRRCGLDGPDSARDVLMLGCSFTLGQGVEDDQHYPARLQQIYWPGWDVKNQAWTHWGTTQAWWVLSERWQRGGRPPKAVFYGWIADHRFRNGLRRSYWCPDGAGLGGKRASQFEVTAGGVRFLRFVTQPDQFWPESPQWEQQETELSLALLADIATQCAQRRVPLVVLLLGEKFPRDDPVAAQLPSRGLTIVDCRQASRSFFEHDFHPTERWHAAVAERVGTAAEAAFLRGSDGARTANDP